MTPALTIDTRDGADGTAVLHVAGDIDLSNVERFRQALAGGPPGERFVVDLTDVTYLDSSGVAALFGRAKQGGLELVIAEGCVVASLVELAHLDDLATIRTS